MPLYMTQFSYTSEAWAAFVRNPEDRRIVLDGIMGKLGCRLISLYYCFGEYDGLVIFEAPDENTALTAILTATTPGHLKMTQTTTLFTVDDGMEAMGKAGQLLYTPPSE